MKTLIEGNLRIKFPDHLSVTKFDDPSTHGLPCMKAVDFILFLRDRVFFIEFKDPGHPKAKKKTATRFVDDFREGKIDQALKYKYRDSLLYMWARYGDLFVDKPIYYWVLVNHEMIDTKLLSHRTDALKKQIPTSEAMPKGWKRSIVEDCMVFSIDTWNAKFPEYPVSRIGWIISKRALQTFWEAHPKAERPLRAWHSVATRAGWSSPADVKAVYPNASVVGGDRIVFNIGGNRYRLVVRFDYAHRMGFVRFVGTHAEYDSIDASSV